jgi:NAD(P)H dehydrogenase (quinone)
MRVFIVHAHPEPKSFNGALTQTATSALRASGHAVEVSDLYAMAWNPVSGRHNFTTTFDREYFKQQAEESHAALHDGFADDVRLEQEKLFWCDALILQFPLWWFGLPAILKGWVDRVFAAGGRVYGAGRWYDRGVFAGKRALCSTTVGGAASMFGRDGLSGPMDAILFPINHGILAFTGFQVVQPFVVHAPVRMTDVERNAQLERYRVSVLSLEHAPTIDYPGLADYDESYVLKRHA